MDKLNAEGSKRAWDAILLGCVDTQFYHKSGGPGYSNHEKNPNAILRQNSCGHGYDCGENYHSFAPEFHASNSTQLGGTPREFRTFAQYQRLK